eukprot:scaffold107580_cov66-Phaeocystis_antarctica.AAC.5
MVIETVPKLVDSAPSVSVRENRNESNATTRSMRSPVGQRAARYRLYLGTGLTVGPACEAQISTSTLAREALEHASMPFRQGALARRCIYSVRHVVDRRVGVVRVDVELTPAAFAHDGARNQLHPEAAARLDCEELSSLRQLQDPKPGVPDLAATHGGGRRGGGRVGGVGAWLLGAIAIDIRAADVDALADLHECFERVVASDGRIVDSRHVECHDSRVSAWGRAIVGDRPLEAGVGSAAVGEGRLVLVCGRLEP